MYIHSYTIARTFLILRHMSGEVLANGETPPKTAVFLGGVNFFRKSSCVMMVSLQNFFWQNIYSKDIFGEKNFFQNSFFGPSEVPFVRNFCYFGSKMSIFRRKNKKSHILPYYDSRFRLKWIFSIKTSLNMLYYHFSSLFSNFDETFFSKKCALRRSFSGRLM